MSDATEQRGFAETSRATEVISIDRNGGDELRNGTDPRSTEQLRKGEEAMHTEREKLRKSMTTKRTEKLRSRNEMYREDLQRKGEG